MKIVLDNGPLMLIPGFHKGEIYNHHHNGIFTGGINSNNLGDRINNAIPLIGSAGDITIHHARTVHASKNTQTDSTSPFLLFSYSAVDAFPIFEHYDIEEYNSRIIRGEPVLQGRMEALPFRIRQPQQTNACSIFENQDQMKRKSTGFSS